MARAATQVSVDVLMSRLFDGDAVGELAVVLMMPSKQLERLALAYGVTEMYKMTIKTLLRL